MTLKQIIAGAGAAFCLTLSVQGIAEDTTSTGQVNPEATSTLTTGAADTSGAKIIGGVEFRPSWKSNIGEVHSEDYAQLGYQFSKNLQTFYRQEFNTNIFNPGSSAQGLGLFAFDGSFRAKVSEILKPTSDLALSYEARAYLPTHAVKRDAGMITALRNYVKLKQTLTSTTALTLEEIPILHVYDRPGNVNAKGGEANPAFENRVYLGVEYKPIKAVKFYVPLILNSVRYREFQAGAKFNDSWGHKVWLYPELTYALNDNTSLGLAYYSDNLVLTDFGGTTIGAGLEKGTTQVILSAAL